MFDWLSDIGSSIGNGLGSIFGGSSGGNNPLANLNGGTYAGDFDAGSSGASYGGALANPSYGDSGLSSIFGQGGLINKYAPGIKTVGGLVDMYRGNQQAKQFQNMAGPQQQFAQQQREGSQYWDQSAKNAQMGTDALTIDAIRQAQQVAERTANQRGVNPIHVRLAAQQAMADPRLKAVQTYGNLSTGFGNNANQSVNGSLGLQNAANAASNRGVASLFGSMAQNIPQFKVVNGRLVQVDGNGNVTSMGD